MKENGYRTYNNPILSGFYPDPSICRVGEDYYMVCSTFEYYPGIPIFHSKDLLNWTIMNHCIQNVDDLPYKNATDSGGMWAPTIRYHDGCFYVTATFQGYGNFLVTAKNPFETWSSPIRVQMGGIDPSLYFEGEKAYYMTNYSLHSGKEEITMAQVDVETGHLIHEPVTLWTGIGGGYLEAPHLYKKDNYYYLLAAEGGTFFNHLVTVARSCELYGPYESYAENPILTNRHDTSKEVQCSGHGDLVEDQYGNWWMVHLGIRLARRTMSHLGRETFLMPVQWIKDWPDFGVDKKSRIQVNAPLWADQERKKGFCSDFRAIQMQKEWMFLRNPKSENYRWLAGSLELKPSLIRFEDQKNPTFVGLRQPDFECRLEAEIAFDPLYETSEGGVVILLNSEFHYRIGIRRRGDNRELFVHKKAEDFEQCVQVIPFGSERIRLAIQADHEKYDFLYQELHSNDGESEMHYICSASTRFLACEVAGRCFTGTVMGVYAYGEEEDEKNLCVYQVEVGC